jgi:predicted translin family RNA/ssDNA-binding protein
MDAANQSVFNVTEDDASTKKIEELEKKISELEEQLADAKRFIQATEENMDSEYVEDWTVHDGAFTGRIYYVKGHGCLDYPDRSSLEGDWDAAGDLIHGKLTDSRGQVLQKWRDGKEVDDSDDESSGDDDDDDDDSS